MAYILIGKYVNNVTLDIKHNFCMQEGPVVFNNIGWYSHNPD